MIPALLLVATASAADAPLDRGLPVRVRTAVTFVDVQGLDENAESFSATVDVRTRWHDGRLTFPVSERSTGFLEFTDEEAEARLQEIWSPQVALANQVGDATNEHVELRNYPNGDLELLRRVSTSFAVQLTVDHFPFDHQELVVDVASLREPATHVALVFDQDDLILSRVGAKEEIAGWTVGSVDLRRTSDIGWHGTTHSHVLAALSVARNPAGTIAPIFIPLFASLLIPFIALWLNESTDEGFSVEAFELANVLIGGLFALIALNFTIYSSYTTLTGDNPISRLFALNYVLLAASLVINLALFRHNMVGRRLGKHVHHELFRVLTWALPALVLITAAWILGVAMS